jgi:hypothetical protein
MKPRSAATWNASEIMDVRLLHSIVDIGGGDAARLFSSKFVPHDTGALDSFPIYGDCGTRAEHIKLIEGNIETTVMLREPRLDHHEPDHGTSRDPVPRWKGCAGSWHREVFCCSTLHTLGDWITYCFAANIGAAITFPVTFTCSRRTRWQRLRSDWGIAL